jgi:hypothetical protein
VLLKASEEQQVLLYRQPPVERRLLRHPADVPVGRMNLSAVWLDGAGQDREQRRLTRSVRTNYGNKLPRLSGEVNAPQRLAGAERLGYPPCLHRRNATAS